MAETKQGRFAGILNRVLRRTPDDSPRVRLGYNSEDRTHYDPTTDSFRKLAPGDMVTTGDDLEAGRLVGQIVTIGRRVIVAPLYHIDADMEYEREARFDYMPHELRLMLAPPVPPTGTPSPATEPKRRRYYERAFDHEGDTLLNLLRAHVGPLNKVRRALESLYEEESYEYRQAHPAEVQQAVFGFYRFLSSDEQRRVLNGWTPYSIRPGAGKLSPSCDGMPVRLAVLIPGDDVRDPDDSINLHGEWTVDESTNAVDVRVFEFSTKAEVIADLKAKLRFIDDKWDQITRAKPYPIDDEREERAA